jgi:hypothetical protein
MGSKKNSGNFSIHKSPRERMYRPYQDPPDVKSQFMTICQKVNGDLAIESGCKEISILPQGLRMLPTLGKNTPGKVGNKFISPYSKWARNG